MRVDYFLDTNKIEQKKENKSQTALSNIEINTLGCGACKKYMAMLFIDPKQKSFDPIILQNIFTLQNLLFFTLKQINLP